LGRASSLIGFENLLCSWLESCFDVAKNKAAAQNAQQLFEVTLLTGTTREA